MKEYVVFAWNWLAGCKDACKTEYVDFFIQIANKENAILLRKVSFVQKNLNTPQLQIDDIRGEVSNGEREKGKRKIRAKMSRNVCTLFDVYVTLYVLPKNKAML